MLIFITILSFVIYNITAFNYYNYVFLPNYSKNKIIVIFTIVNTLPYWVYLANIQLYPYWMIYIFYILIYVAEVSLIYKTNLIKSLFFVSSLGIIHFIIKTVTTSIFLIFITSPSEASTLGVELQHIITAISFALSVPIFFFLKRVFPRNIIDTLLSNRHAITFANIIYSTLFSHLLINTVIHEFYSFEQRLTVYNIKMSALVLFIYFMATLYTIIFARLQVFADNYNHINELVQEEEKKLSALNQEATTDMLTGFKTRDVSEKAICNYISEKSAFYVVFIDLDGLKTTNDAYGHEEGDFYIKHVSEVITRCFMGNIISRIGGDEFLIVGNILDEYNLRNSITICHDKVVQISSTYKKPYNTSISYGAVFVEENTKMNMDEIIALADSRMYEFKSKRKRLRTVLNPNSKKFA